MLTASLISTVLGTALPGKGTVLLSMETKFTAPVYIGDTITACVEVIEKKDDKRTVTLKAMAVNQSDKTVLEGIARVMKLRDEEKPSIMQ